MRRIVLLLSAMAAALLLASWVGLFNAVKPAEATFPGQNGRIVFANVGSYDIFTINPDGSDKFQVTNNDTAEYDPAYSPDGKWIVYSGYVGHGSDTEIFTIDVGGGTPVQITNNNTDDSDPAYSPDGSTIAYTGFDGHDSEIRTINAGGGTSLKSPTTAGTTTVLLTRPAARSSPTRAGTEKTRRSIRSTSTGRVGSKLLTTTISSTGTLPTRPTARGSPTRAKA